VSGVRECGMAQEWDKGVTLTVKAKYDNNAICGSRQCHANNGNGSISGSGQCHASCLCPAVDAACCSNGNEWQ